MVDTRFYSCSGPTKLGELLAAAGHESLIPNSDSQAGLTIAGAGDLAQARDDEIGFAADARYRDALARSGAAVIVATPALAGDAPDGAVVLVDEDAYDTFIDIVEVLYPDRGDDGARRAAGAGTGVDPGAQLESGVEIGPGAVIGAGCEIGEGTVIGPNAVLGPGVAVGRNSMVGAGASLECTLAGDAVVIQPGARIGNSSFGFLPRAKGLRKIPQLGRAIVQDGVQIGANTVVDRGTLADTVIGEGTKIGNLVQIAHNCRIGRRCMIVGATAFAGSVSVGDGVIFGGAVKVVGFVHIGDGSIIQADTLVTKSCPPKSRLAGIPGRDVRQWRRDLAAFARLGRTTKSR